MKRSLIYSKKAILGKNKILLMEKWKYSRLSNCKKRNKVLIIRKMNKNLN